MSAGSLKKLWMIFREISLSDRPWEKKLLIKQSESRNLFSIFYHCGINCYVKSCYFGPCTAVGNLSMR